jgi:hypothetical protein
METQTTSAPTPSIADFLGQFSGMARYIRKASEFDQLTVSDKFKPVDSVNDRALSKLLLNAWSAEFALRITPAVNDSQYLQSSLHWTFPQAYYSALFSVRAMLFAQGFNFAHEDLIKKQIGKNVFAGLYPTSLGFYVAGKPRDYVNRRFVNAISETADLQTFAMQSRSKQLGLLIKQLQSNPKTALRHPTSGAVLSKVPISAAEEVAKRLGYTTWFDLLARLRISTTSRDLESYTSGPFENVQLFHSDLVDILGRIAAVHEFYVAKAIGIKRYELLVSGTMRYLQEGFVRERFNEIKRILA